MRSLLGALHRFWFSPASSSPLAAMRIVVCGYMLVSMLSYDLARTWRALKRPREFMDPAVALDLFPLPYTLAAEWLLPLSLLVYGLGVLATLGLFARPALFLFAACYWSMGAVIGAWGYIPHSRILPVQALMILAFAPGTTAWSVDRLLQWAWRRRRGSAPPLRAALAGRPVPRWGIQLVLVIFATVMFSAGISKLRYSGWEWTDGRTLGFYLAGGSVRNVIIPDTGNGSRPGLDRRPHLSYWTDGFSQFVGRKDLTPDVAWKDGVGLESYLFSMTVQPMGRRVASHSSAVVALSFMSLFLELLAPLMLVGSRLRSLYLLAATGFFLGIDATMGISFVPWVVVGLCLVDWRWLASPLLVRTGLLQRMRDRERWRRPRRTAAQE